MSNSNEIPFDTFVELHKSQLELSGVPKHFWNTIYVKVKETTFDAGEAFSLLRLDYGNKRRGEYEPVWQLQVKLEGGIQASDPNHLYLVDHAWTYRIENARKQLRGIDSLRHRMASIVGLDTDMEAAQLAGKIYDELWRYCDCYWTASAENVEDRIAVWYMMDEVGSAINHSDEPNFRVVPFIHIPEQVVYSLIFPVEDLECGEVVTRNFVEKDVGEKERAALTLPWKFTSFLEESYVNQEPTPDYFLSGHIQESLPILAKVKDCKMHKLDKYKVYTEYSVVAQHLTDDKFELTQNEEEADILWYTRHFKDFEGLSETPHKFVNQFPFEYVLTVKDLLCIICRRKANKSCDNLVQSSPSWLPVTYNLATEVVKFASYFQHRERAGLDNHWIIKPFNLARGLDTHITNNINYIVRLPVTGPKIAQKYVDNPVLIYRPECSGKVKFDIRYVILLKSTSPLQIYIYKKFFLRFANKVFEMCDFDDYTKHFTVMNYTQDGKQLKHMPCDEFKLQWSQQYPNLTWESTEKKILDMLKEIFQCALMECPPCGISESPQSRALYAVDLMLEWTASKDVQPKLLEINWTPDCQRACEYYPNFFNDVFKLLFLDDNTEELFYKL